MQPPTDKPDGDQTPSVDGLQSSHNFTGSGKVIQPSPGFDPNTAKPSKLEEPAAETDAPAPPDQPPAPAEPTLAPAPPPTLDPAPTPPVPPPPPTPPSGPPAPAPMSSAASFEYHSNPFALLIHGLSRVFAVNGISGLLLSFYFYLVVIIGYFAFLGLIISGVLASAGGAAIGIVVMAIIGGLILAGFIGALYALTTTSLEGQPASPGQLLGRGFGKLLPLIGLGILTAIIFLIGLILVILPGLFLIGRLSMAPYVMIAEDLGPIAALRRSFRLSKGHVFEVYGALFAGSVLASQGLLAPVVFTAGLGMRYEEIKQLQESGTAKPKTHWLNFLVPVGLVVMIAVFIGIGVLVGHKAAHTTTTTSPYGLQYNSGTGTSSSGVSYPQ